MRFLPGFICCVPALLLLCGCIRSDEDTGVVARVNERPIYLSQLEAAYDFNQMDGIGELSPSVSRLREDYGALLTDLIIRELIDQELNAQGLSITGEDIARAEEDVRRDYPGDTFEQVLVEEYVDLDMWRSRLRDKLAMERFFDRVLRSQVRLSFEEAKTYYDSHINDFYLPERVEFLVFRSEDKGSLLQALKSYKPESDLEKVRGEFRQLQIHKIKMREDRLPPPWHMALKDLKEGQQSLVLSDKSGFQAFIAVKRFPGKVLEPTTSYPLIEKILMEKKLQQLFDAWLEKSLAQARIEVSVHLLEEFQKDRQEQDGG